LKKETIRFNAPEQDTLILSDGRKISGGGIEEVDEEEAMELATAPWTDVEILTAAEAKEAQKESKAKPLKDHTRGELNRIAEEEGVNAPQTLSTKEDVVKVIELARKGKYVDPTTVEPEAKSEGQNDDDDGKDKEK
jgi:hypothetical protein